VKVGFVSTDLTKSPITTTASCGFVAAAFVGSQSTLVRLLVGDLLPLTGDVWRHPSLRVAYVAQHSLGHIEHHLDKTPVEYLQWRFVGAVDREALAMSALQPSVDPNPYIN
jgi:ATPase subunit of ABC transporter with duplicated ATPase domains